jgi:hypothetical protein
MPVYGQVTNKTGSVKGHISASNIARKMQLFLLDSAKSIKRSTNINGKGRYRFDAVPVGRYRLRLPSYDVHFIDSPIFNVLPDAVAKVDFRVEVNCRLYDSKVAESDIIQKNAKLFLKARGVSGPVIFTDDTVFENRYKVAYDYSGCILPDINECLISYNRAIFNHLDSMYGKRWRRTIRRDVVGLHR